MLIELLSMSNYISFNIKLAQILGLEAAIYLSEIMNINEKAIRKQKIEEDFFTIDRNYIEKRTTISIKKQQEIEKTLLKIGILEKSSETPDTISLNITILTSILMNPDEKLIKNINKIIKQNAKSPKAKKDDAIKENLRNYISTTNEELTQAYSKWIEAVYTKDGWMSSEAIVMAEETIDNFCNRNLDLALNIIRIATLNGYRDMSWAIKAYKKDYNVSFRVSNNTIPACPNTTVPQVSDEVF
ncbi:MAG: hypothetical protein J6R47_04640 [Acholeplasmatales bacterium]|nr:hypothetical protein [Acholeplasmatales bacterium]